MGVEVQAFIDHLGVAGDQNVARSTEFHQRIARLIDTRREGGQHVVGAADDQGGACPQARRPAAVSLRSPAQDPGR